MGIGSLFRRWFGGSGKSVPCALCRSPIPPGDLKKGAALVIARKEFCRGCVEEITRRNAQGNVPGWTLSADVGSSSTVILG